MNKYYIKHQGLPYGGLLAAAAATLLAALLATGCDEDTARVALAAVGSQSKPYQEFVDDPVTLSTVKSVVVFPFANLSSGEGLSPEEFAQRLSNQLASQGELRVIYPNEAQAATDRENDNIRRHNSEYRSRVQLGQSLSELRKEQRRSAEGELRDNVAADEDKRLEYLDPVTKLEDALKLGRILHADAVVTGAVTDFDPYMRPRISLWMQVAATGTTAGQAQELSDLCQWGVAKNVRSAKGVVWFRQQNFDSRDGNVGVGAYMHALKRHSQYSAFDTDSYVRSPTLYLDYVGLSLAESLLSARQEAIAEAERRAAEEARRQKQSEELAQRRIHSLIYDKPTLPEGDKVMAQNHQTRTESEWRPDIYNRDHPVKSDPLYTADRLAE